MKRFLFFIAVVVVACTKENPVEVGVTDGVEKVMTNSADDFVSKDEASKIANRFVSKKGSGQLNLKGHNQAEKTVKSVETLFGEDGKPTMYLINYNSGGFAVISAVKSYYPILAYSDNSMLTLQSFNNINGLALWAEETKQAIKKSKNSSEQEAYRMRSLWTAYETESISVSNTLSQDFSYEQYAKFYQRMSQLYSLAPGFSFGPLSSAQSYLSQSEYNNLVSRANMYGSPLGVTIFGYKSKPAQEVGPLIETVWHQGYGFNNLIPNQPPAGCVAIAMAQIMKFHQFPATYNWSNMPLNYGTYDTQRLVYDLGLATNMQYGTDGSGTTIDEAKSAFSSMGYSVAKKDHNPIAVDNELMIQRRPVYMRGSGSNGGHAWVCEGARTVSSTVDYFVEYIGGDGTYSSYGGPSWQMPIASSGFSTLYFYLNWGWGPNSGNGWYLSNSANSPSGNFDQHRQNLYISR